ncbi:hypothetical protein DFO69_1462 [Bacillus subtilis]|nr:hypothetical protein DFO69_1462 [Bacillus subtilis]
MGDKDSWNRHIPVNKHTSVSKPGSKPVGFGQPRKVQSSRVKDTDIKLDSRRLFFNETPPSTPKKRNNK